MTTLLIWRMRRSREVYSSPSDGADGVFADCDDWKSREGRG